MTKQKKLVWLVGLLLILPLVVCAGLFFGVYTQDFDELKADTTLWSLTITEPAIRDFPVSSAIGGASYRYIGDAPHIQEIQGVSYRSNLSYEELLPVLLQHVTAHGFELRFATNPACSSGIGPEPFMFSGTSTDQLCFDMAIDPDNPGGMLIKASVVL